MGVAEIWQTGTTQQESPKCRPLSPAPQERFLSFQTVSIETVQCPTNSLLGTTHYSTAWVPTLGCPV